MRFKTGLTMTVMALLTLVQKKEVVGFFRNYSILIAMEMATGTQHQQHHCSYVRASLAFLCLGTTAMIPTLPSFQARWFAIQPIRPK